MINVLCDFFFPATDSYEGCFTGNESRVEIGSHGISTCRQHCLALDKAYALLRGAVCACADVSGTAAVDDVQCNLGCENSEGKLCGGDPDLWSVYTTFRECVWLPFLLPDLVSVCLCLQERRAVRSFRCLKPAG